MGASAMRADSTLCPTLVGAMDFFRNKGTNFETHFCDPDCQHHVCSRQPSLTGLSLRKTLGAKSRWKNRQNPRDPNDQCLAETYSGSLSSYRGHEQHQ